MISVLIPVYNYEVAPLVEKLHGQGRKLGIPFEILIFDDGSDSPSNQKNNLLNKLDQVIFKSLEKNVGLSQNRNLLAEAAQYENLLFIDGDSLVEDDFLQNYHDSIDSSTEVIYGGRVHPEDFPEKKGSLRWKYGRFIEDKPAHKRRKNPYRSTLFNNTLVRKQVFKTIVFEKFLTKYGHEDTLFAYGLERRKISVKHIENPVIHGDIDPNGVFLKKTQMGLDNLKQICKRGMVDPDFVKLSKVHSYLRKIGLDRVLSWFYLIFKKPMQGNLLSKNPSLKVFALYRLTYFCRIYR